MHDNHSYKEEGRIPALSVVVLCYKSGETIIPFLEQMEQEFRDKSMDDYELVLVANYTPGAHDSTPQVVRRLAEKNPYVVTVTLEKRGMMGWDMRSGLQAARGQAIALIDGDGQMPSRDIVRIYQVLKSGEFDLVKTFRKTRMDGALRRFISIWYNLIFHLLFPGASFRDVNAKPKVMTRDAYRKMSLSCDDWFIDAEIMLESMRLDLNVAEVPTIFYKNEWRGSLVKSWTALEFLVNLIKYRVIYWFK